MIVAPKAKAKAGAAKQAPPALKPQEPPLPPPCPPSRSDVPDWEAPAPAGWWRVMHRGCAWASNNQHVRNGAHCTNKVVAALVYIRDDRCKSWILLRDEEEQWLPVEGYDQGCGYLLEPLRTGQGPPPAKYRLAHEQAVKAVLQEKAKLWGAAQRMVDSDPEARVMCLGGSPNEGYSVDFVAGHLAAFSLVNLDFKTGCCTAPHAHETAEVLLGVHGGDMYSKPVRRLLEKGYVVIDDAVPKEVLQAMWEEADKLKENGTMKVPSQRTTSQRGDSICWVDEKWLSIPVPKDGSAPAEGPGISPGAWMARESLSAGVALLKGVADALNPALTARHHDRRRAGFVEHKWPVQPPATDEAVLTVAPKAMLASYPADSIGYIAHQDSTFRHQYGNRTNPRELTAILYINPPDWDPERDGGEVRIYPNSEHLESPPQDVQHEEWAGTTTIAPLGGRIVVFFSRLWHEVLPAKRERRALTLWIFRPNKEEKLSQD